MQYEDLCRGSGYGTLRGWTQAGNMHSPAESATYGGQDDTKGDVGHGSGDDRDPDAVPDLPDEYIS